jgi:hypothetical protein
MVPPTSRIAEAMHSRRRFDASLSHDVIARGSRTRIFQASVIAGCRSASSAPSRPCPALSFPFLPRDSRTQGGEYEQKLELRPALARARAAVRGRNLPPIPRAAHLHFCPAGSSRRSRSHRNARGWIVSSTIHISRPAPSCCASSSPIVVLSSPAGCRRGLRRAWPSLFHHHRQAPPSDSSDDSISLFVLFDDQPPCEASQKRCEP